MRKAGDEEGLEVLIVLKYGGNAMLPNDGSDPLLDELSERIRCNDSVVIVHGGGPHIDAALAARNIVTTRVAGLRVTHSATLETTESVLCGTVNKALVRALQRRGVRAAGISGQDGPLLVACFAGDVQGVSLGFVGEIAEVRPAILESLLAGGFLPVVAPLAVTADAGTALNVNADTAAGAIAGALQADAYVIVTNVNRVRRVPGDPATGIARLTVTEAQAYIDDGTFDAGMRPKMQSALDALARGARTAVIAGSGPGALGLALAGEGTIILRG